MRKLVKKILKEQEDDGLDWIRDVRPQYPLKFVYENQDFFKDKTVILNGSYISVGDGYSFSLTDVEAMFNYSYIGYYNDGEPILIFRILSTSGLSNGFHRTYHLHTNSTHSNNLCDRSDCFNFGLENKITVTIR